MNKMIVEPAFWEVFPEGQLNILIVKGIDNHKTEVNEAYFADLLTNAMQEAKGFLKDEIFSQNEVIAEWREAFSKFKTKKGARSSIEALLKRVSQEKIFTPINLLVDCYNSISLKYGVPCGGEDSASINGALRLGIATGGEDFRPLGADKDAPALAGEFIYYDNEGAICRCLNWREAQRTLLTEETKDAILVIESINEKQSKRANQAMNELQKEIQTYFGAEATSFTLVKEKSEIAI